MPQRKNAIKALRINRNRHLSNMQVKTDLKKTIKTFKSLVADKKFTEAKESLNSVYKQIDKAAKRNVLHKNTASRRKSFFSRMLIPTKKA